MSDKICNCGPIPDPPSEACPIHGKDACPECGGKMISRGIIGYDEHGREQEADWEECASCAFIP